MHQRGQQASQPASSRTTALEHGFGAVDGLTLGVEEEFMLVHPGTYELVPAYSDVAELATPEGIRVASEVTRSVVEAITPVCADVAEVERHLVRQRAVLAAAAHDSGCRLAGAGTHPCCWTELEQVTDEPRYRQLHHDFPWVARESVTYGMHVHVGMPSPDAAIGVMNGLRPLLPVLVALSTNSPFWKGAATGLRSVRMPLAGLYPRSGVAPRFGSWEEYTRTLHALHAADGQAPDPSKVWWLVRPAPTHGTIEVRVFDTQTDVDEAVALTAMVQAMCDRLLAGDARLAQVLGDAPDVVIEENIWAATRSGCDAGLIDVARSARVPVREALAELLDVLAEPMGRLGSQAHLATIERMALRNGADRQLEHTGAPADFQPLMRELVRRTATAPGVAVAAGATADTVTAGAASREPRAHSLARA
jgi:glutamate---cysteine ligase / carboxylate-amine ligase